VRQRIERRAREAQTGCTYQTRERVVRRLKLIAAALAVCTLNACVGFIVPLPGSSTTTTTTSTQDDSKTQRR
jgi:hypothetical protein